MYKKLYVPVVLALVAALAFSGVAFAKSSLPKNETRRVGDIISVDKATNTFRVHSLSGLRYTVHVDSATTWVGISGLAALKSDDRLSMDLQTLSDGTLRADRIKLIPETNEKDLVHGVVTAISAHSFTVMDRQNQSFTFMVTSKTTFTGNAVPHFRELKAGMSVAVTFSKSGTTMDAMKVVVK